MSKLDLSVLIQAVDRFSAPVKKIIGMSDKMTKSMIVGQNELNAMGKQHAAIKKFRLLAGALRDTSQAMKLERANVAKLGKAISKTANPTKIMISNFEQAKRKSSALRSSYSDS